MKKICCLVFSFFLLFSLVSCFGSAKKYDYVSLSKKSFSAELCGEWYGTQIEARIEMREAQGGARDFYIQFLSGSLSGVIVRREGEKVKISIGGVEERDFYAGGLCDIAKILCPEECALIRADKNGETGVFSAKVGDCAFYITVRADGVPKSFENDGNFSLKVKDFSLVK